VIAGLDYSVSAIKYAVEHFPGIDFVVGDAYDCPYPPGYFDIVVCNNLWEHVADPLVLLAKVAQVLSEQGFLILSTPSRYRWGNIANILRGRPIEFMSPHHVTEYTVGQVFEQLRYKGFKVIRAYSKSYRTDNWTFEVAKKLFAVFVLLTRSHHQLESTVFYLARRVLTSLS
jgi:SAM-dependent methyltransferase